MHRIDGAGHVDNKFVAEDAATNRPPTEVTPEIMNAFQEELATFIEWAGLELAKGDNSQLRKALLAKFATLESPELVGNPKAPTPDQGSDVKSLVNIEFLRAALTALGLSGYAKLGEANVWLKGQSGAEALLPATTGTVTLDLAQSNNWGPGPKNELVLTGNIVLANPASMPGGQSGVIRLVNGATPYAIAYGAYWKPLDGVTLPALTEVAGACNDLVYYVETDTRVLVGRVGGSV